MSGVFLLLLVAYSLSLAEWCDTIVYIGAPHTVKHEGEGALYARGCRKGCFWNNTYDKKNVLPKCEKCSLIEDKKYCENWIAYDPLRNWDYYNPGDSSYDTPPLPYNSIITYNWNYPQTCQWTKKNKCAAMSCPALVERNKKIDEDRKADYDKCMSDANEDRAANDATCNGISDADAKALCLNGSEMIHGEAKVNCHQSFGYPIQYPTERGQNQAQHRYACHNIYNCMYSKENSRCSYWSIWAFVLALVLSIVTVLVVIGVIVCVLYLKVFKKGKVAVE